MEAPVFNQPFGRGQSPAQGLLPVWRHCCDWGDGPEGETRSGPPGLGVRRALSRRTRELAAQWELFILVS